MSRADRSLTTRQSGQASVEAVAVVPLVLLAALAAWQLVLAGHTLSLCAEAARAAARADAVGADPRGAARAVLPGALERGLRVSGTEGGRTRVAVHIPILLPAWRSPVRVAATASLGGDR